MEKLPLIIQGGMGAGVSNWRLARAVAQGGQLGVVSGTALDLIFVRRLQCGDPGGHMQSAAAHFPDQEFAQRIIKKFYIEGGKDADASFKNISMPSAAGTRDSLGLTVLANFVEVFLAKEGHGGVVGINLLEKIQIPNLPSLYGAMLAGVDYVLMGAGIPWEVPGILDRFANHQEASMKLKVEEAGQGEEFVLTFNPAFVLPGLTEPLRRPKFLPIVSSAVLAQALLRRATGRIDGFVVEGPKAGGHNSPPRGALKLSESGEPIYGPRDEADLGAMKALGLPFWLAGTYGRRGRLGEALEAGAAGVQVGTAFAFCRESGMDPEVRLALIEKARSGDAHVFTDPKASPTGFPFKVALLEGTVSEQPVYEERTRVCDLGYLRSPYRREDGSLGYRCPSEPVDHYTSKGGDVAETEGRKCLCNALMANIGMPQNRQDGSTEKPLITSGDDLVNLAEYLPPGATDYSAAEVLALLLEGVPA